jgi:hypothetical protein
MLRSLKGLCETIGGHVVGRDEPKFNFAQSHLTSNVVVLYQSPPKSSRVNRVTRKFRDLILLIYNTTFQIYQQ